jgi:hypothetical protein
MPEITTKAEFVPVVKRIVTLPLLKFVKAQPEYVKILDKIFTGKTIKNDIQKDKDGNVLPPKAPPEMANVVNLKTGELAQIMLGKVLCGILEEDYPSGDPAKTYVGRCFALTLTESKRGRNGGNYNTYNVAEIEDPSPSVAVAKANGKK